MECISLCAWHVLFLYFVGQCMHSCIEPSLYWVDFFLEIFLCIETAYTSLYRTSWLCHSSKKLPLIRPHLHNMIESHTQRKRYNSQATTGQSTSVLHVCALTYRAVRTNMFQTRNHPSALLSSPCSASLLYC